MTQSSNTVSQEDLPGDFAIWIFIFAEMLAFGVLFVAYAFTRAQNIELFNASQLTLSRTSGAINTLVLITSSYFVVRGVAAIKHGMNKQCAHWLTGAFLLGGVFVCIKLVEFHAKFAADITMSTNNFYMFYLSLTFFHFMHVLMGMVILAVIIMKAKRGGYSAQDHVGVETGACFGTWWIFYGLSYFRWFTSFARTMMNNTKPPSNLFFTIIWLALVALTVMTFSLGEAGMSGKGVMLTLLAITMIKSQLVANYFMGLRKAKFLWRAIMFGYFTIVGGLIAGAYLMGLK